MVRVLARPALVLAVLLGSTTLAAQSAPAALGSAVLQEHVATTAVRVHASTLLAGLKVRAETPAGYARSKFPLWADADHDGCNTRNEVLLAEAVRHPSRGRGCALSGGRWRSKYDGKTFRSASRLDIDHVVPLNEAWQSGAKRWTKATRKAYANDLTYGPSLIAVSASSNRSKGDREPQNWMPQKSSYRCTYLATWVAVKWRWRLAVDYSEKSFLAAGLRGCGSPSIKKPKRANVKVAGGASGGSVAATAYVNCTAMHVDYPHGVGRPGAVDSTSGTPVTNFVVSSALYDANKGSDRDGDGIACEA